MVPKLDKRKTARKFRIEVLKAFYGWLGKERHLLTSADEPILDLPVPQASPEKHRKQKVIPQDHVMAVREHASQLVRDVIDVSLATAWHGTEVRRFAIEGNIIERPHNAKDGPTVWPPCRR